MAKVKYKIPVVGMDRMIVKEDNNARLSLGMTEVRAEIYYLSPNILIPFRNQARQDINENSLLELVASIQSQGIIQPLQVIPSINTEGKFEVVSGERRLRAALKLALDSVPCMILNRDRDADEIALIENIQREDLHPIELADAISKLLQGTKHGSQTEFAEKIGVSKSQISHLLSISRLPEDIKKHFLLKKSINIDFLKKISYLKDEKIMRDKVFRSPNSNRKYKSILRLSFNGNSFRVDRLNLDQLDLSEKGLLKNELLNLINKLDDV